MGCAFIDPLCTLRTTMDGSLPGSSIELNDNEQAQLPLLIVGPPGSGKTFELAVQTIMHMWRDMVLNPNKPRRTLCLAAHNTARLALEVKMNNAMDVLQLQRLDVNAEREIGSNPFVSGSPPVVRAVLAPRFDTIHHTCRRWLETYGHLIGKANAAQVCTDERADSILVILQGCPDPDVLSDELAITWPEVVKVTKQTLFDELTLAFPSDDMLRAAIGCALRCRRINLTACQLRHFIRLYKLNSFTLTEGIQHTYEDRQIDDACEMREYYDMLLVHNLLYDFEDLVIYGLQLVEDHAQRILSDERIGLM